MTPVPEQPNATPAPIAQLRQLIERVRSTAGLLHSEPLAEPVDAAAPGLGSLMDRVRAKVSARRAGFVEAQQPPVDVPQFAPDKLALPRAPRGPAGIEMRDEYALDELLSVSDSEFVHNAYRALLRREPDPPGYLHHRSLLDRGEVSRSEMLVGLLRSPEGQQHGVRVRGLSRALLLERIGRWPIVGYVVDVARQLGNLPGTIRRLEAHERRLHRSHEELAATIDALADACETFANGQSDRSAAAFRTTADSLQRMDREKAPQAMGMSLIATVAALRLELSKVAEDGARLASRAAGREELLRIAETALSAVAELDANKENKPTVDHDLDDFYIAFEDAFRGKRSAIKERVAVYLPTVTAVVRKAGGEILDVGCGRGEWLELLKDSGLSARGVDLNRAMVNECRELGLEVVEDDLIAYLADTPSGSLGAITGFHIIEHLPFTRFLTLLDETLRVLKPGGVAIFETPNPENVTVGSCNFWYDPTHERPMPPEPTKRIAELRGFARVEVLRLHPFPFEAHLPKDGDVRDRLVRDRLNHLFYGAQDYSILAYKSEQA